MKIEQIAVERNVRTRESTLQINVWRAFAVSSQLECALAIIAAALMLAAPLAHAADIKSQIDAANRAWVAAYEKGDAAAVAALYTQDATVLPPGSDMVHGRANIQAFWQKAMASGLKIKTLQAVSVEQYGNVAREIGTATGEANGPVDVKYVVIWKWVSGAWHLSTDIWNSNK